MAQRKPLSNAHKEKIRLGNLVGSEIEAIEPNDFQQLLLKMNPNHQLINSEGEKIKGG